MIYTTNIRHLRQYYAELHLHYTALHRLPNHGKHHNDAVVGFFISIKHYFLIRLMDKFLFFEIPITERCFGIYDNVKIGIYDTHTTKTAKRKATTKIWWLFT